MYCDICQTIEIKDSTFETLDEQAGASDVIACRSCADKLYHDAKAVVKLICKLPTASLISLRWKTTDED